MPDHLMSVRFDGDTLDMLRTVADIHDTNVAEEIRTAVANHLRGIREDADFLKKVDEAATRRQAKIDQLLGVTK